MDDQIVLFDKYLEGQLSGDELMVLEQQLLSDTDLRLKFDLYRRTISHVNALSDKQRKETLSDLGQSIYDPPREVSLSASMWTPIRIAASVSIVFIMGYVIYQSYFQSYTNQELYNQYFEALPAQNFALRDERTDQLYVLWDEALMAYRQGHFEQAVVQFDHLSLQSDFQLKSPAALYGGLSYMELNQQKKAIVIFDRIKEQHLIQDQALWFKSLSLLQIHETEQAKVILKEIRQSPTHYFYEDAINLLKQMERIQE